MYIYIAKDGSISADYYMSFISVWQHSLGTMWSLDCLKFMVIDHLLVHMTKTLIIV